MDKRLLRLSSLNLKFLIINCFKSWKNYKIIF